MYCCFHYIPIRHTEMCTLEATKGLPVHWSSVGRHQYAAVLYLLWLGRLWESGFWRASSECIVSAAWLCRRRYRGQASCFAAPHVRPSTSLLRLAWGPGSWRATSPFSESNLSLQVTLQGAGFLFCSPKCEAEYIMVAGGSALRRTLRDLERGICQLCKLDCLQLVKRLRYGLI